jgi:hypothetical protein
VTATNPPEKVTGTSARTCDSVYDDVGLDEMRDALQSLNQSGTTRNSDTA